MRIYTVHSLKHAPADGEGFVFVREGFSWGGLIFGWLWLLYRRLWIPLILWVAAVVAISVLAEATHIDETVPVIVAFAMQFWLGFEGNDLWRWVLERKGYAQADLVVAPNLTGAERIFFDRWKGPVDLGEEPGNWISPKGGVWPKKPRTGKEASAGGLAPAPEERHPAPSSSSWPRRDDENVLGLFPKPQA